MEKTKEINSRYAMIADQKRYLSSTDYHLLKQMEGGYVVPQDVLFERAEARENINQLQSEIAELALLEDKEESSFASAEPGSQA